MIIFRFFSLSVCTQLNCAKIKKERKERRSYISWSRPLVSSTLYLALSRATYVLHIHDRAFTKKKPLALYTNAKKGICANMPILRLVFFFSLIYLFSKFLINICTYSKTNFHQKNPKNQNFSKNVQN